MADEAIRLGRLLASLFPTEPEVLDLHPPDPGPYQLQAAIAVLRASATGPDGTPWQQIDTLYQMLEAQHPSSVVTLNRAAKV